MFVAPLPRLCVRACLDISTDCPDTVTSSTALLSTLGEK